MVDLLRPTRGGFPRTFGCAEFVFKFLAGDGPYGSSIIDREVGACQADIFYHYKIALMWATAIDRATGVEERQARRQYRSIESADIERLAERYFVWMPYKSQGCRLHSFIVYFSTLQRLGWVETTGKEEPSSFQGHYPPGPPRRYFGLTDAGRVACETSELIPSALFTANIVSTGRKAHSN